MANNRKLFNALLDAHKGSRSGILRVQRASAKKQLILREGKLAFAESNLPEEHLARILVQNGLLPRAALSEVTQRMKAGKTSEEAVLEVSGSDMRILKQGRREQAVAILASLLGWDDCDVRFFPGENLVRYQLDLGMALPEMLVLSARRSASIRLASIPPDFFHGSFFVPKGNGLEAEHFPLDPSESHACSLVRGTVRLADLFALALPGGTKPQELFLRLFMLGLIERHMPTATQPIDDFPAGNESGPLPAHFEEMLARLEAADPYEILGIKTDASQEEVQSAYHGLARQFHPDRFQSGEFSAEVRDKAERILSAVNESYATLRDPGSRAIFDEKRLKEASPVKAGASAASEQERAAKALFRQGRECLARGDFEKAAEHLKGSVWLCPDRADYHRYLGVAQSEMPKYRKTAEQHLLKAVELDCLSTESRLELAKLYLKASLPRKAWMQLQEILRWDPENPEAHQLSAELKQLDKSFPGWR